MVVNYRSYIYLFVVDNIQKRMQYGLVSDLSGNSVSAVANPGDISNVMDADNSGTVDQTDLIEAITFASLYGFQVHDPFCILGYLKFC